MEKWEDEKVSELGQPAIGRLVLRDALLVAAMALYVVSFWGNFGRSWPAPIHRYSGWLTNFCWRAYATYWHQGRAPYDHWMPLWVGLSWVLGLAVPLAIAAALSRRPGELGLGLPNRWGWRMAWVCLAIVAPFAMLFAWEQSVSLSRTFTLGRCVLILLVTVPEHVLLTGVFLAMLLPGGRIPRRGEPVSLTGSPGRRVLSWLGLGQPGRPQDTRVARFLAWWGVDMPGVVAMTGVGILFGLVHVGAQPIEFATSFPGGFALGYLVLRSGSIWPGWLIHAAQMGFVLALVLGRGVRG